MAYLLVFSVLVLFTILCALWVYFNYTLSYDEHTSKTKIINNTLTKEKIFTFFIQIVS